MKESKFVDGEIEQLEVAVLEGMIAAVEGMIEVECPHCGEVYRMMPDVFDVLECWECGKEFEVKGVV